MKAVPVCGLNNKPPSPAFRNGVQAVTIVPFAPLSPLHPIPGRPGGVAWSASVSSPFLPADVSSAVASMRQSVPYTQSVPTLQSVPPSIRLKGCGASEELGGTEPVAPSPPAWVLASEQYLARSGRLETRRRQRPQRVAVA